MSLKDLFLNNLDKINWRSLSSNPNAIEMLEKNLDKVYYWSELAENPNAMHLLEKNIDKIRWECLSKNPNAIDLLSKNLDKVDWHYFQNPNAIKIIEEKFR